MTIILVGMPGCGKSVIGFGLSKKLNMEFIDTDTLIERNEKRTITEIFEQNGEEYFRNIEADILKSVIDKDAVISTGGGIVVRQENIDLLKQSKAKVIFIDRKTEDILSTMRAGNRPLLKDNTDRIYRLYEERYNRYCDAADIRVTNDTTKQDVLNKIAEVIV